MAVRYSQNYGTDGNSLPQIPNTKPMYTSASMTSGPPLFPNFLASVDGTTFTFFCYRTSKYSPSIFFPLRLTNVLVSNVASDQVYPENRHKCQKCIQTDSCQTSLSRRCEVREYSC